MTATDADYAQLPATFREALERAKEAERQCDEWLATQDTTPHPCEVHPDILRPLDREHTFGAWRGEDRRLVYSACPVCQEDTLLLRSGVPPNMLHARFATFAARDEAEHENLRVVREFAAKQTGFLVLIGNVGTGKTHLAVAAMRGLKRAVYLTQSGLLRMLRETYKSNRATDPVELCQDASLLVLDELGLSGGGRDELPMLHEILSCRYDYGMPTILASNHSLAQLGDVLGERMVDRLRECAFAILSFGGESHRPKMRDRYLTTPHQRSEWPWSEIADCL